jgi:hypothetical protein
MLAGAFTEGKLPQLMNKLRLSPNTVSKARNPSYWHAVTVTLQFPAGGLL